MAPEGRRDEGTSYGCRCRPPVFLAAFECEDFVRPAAECGRPVFLPCDVAAEWCTAAWDWAGCECFTAGGATAGGETTDVTVVTGC